MALNQRNPRVAVDQFSMVPRADVPRSTFRTRHTHKTTTNGSWLHCIIVKEILPGDSIKGVMTLFARMNTLLFPLMDHITAETFYFFTPSRILWTNWVRMMGQQDNPAASISYTVPQVVSPAGGFPVSSIFDQMGLPTVGQMGGAATKSVNVLPLRAHNMIWNEWFRDQNIQNPLTVPTDDGPDAESLYPVTTRNKKPDYFTSALPWPLKGGVDVTMPFAGQAPVTGLGRRTAVAGTAGPISVTETDIGVRNFPAYIGANTNEIIMWVDAGTSEPQVYADLSLATGATISALRLAFQTQRLLERDARSGTRYTEHLRAHWGVQPEDARLQRPEYIGGGRSSVHTQAIPQTSATGLTGGTSPAGALTGASTITGQHHFLYNATEHGYLIGYINIDAEITYQQGVHRMWTRLTRFDFYIPVLAHLSEQAIRNDEIYVQGTAADEQTFGYQERWAEYRHDMSRISGRFRSTAANNIDEWHSAQQFASLPTLNSTFISQDPPFDRNLAAGSTATTTQTEFLLDMLFDITITRAMPMRSVPGGIDRF